MDSSGSAYGVSSVIITTQGLTLVHFSAQRKRLLWVRGCIWRLFRGFLGGVRGYWAVCRVHFV